MKRTKWTDRKFNFDFPIGLLPNILERLRGTSARLKEMTISLTDEIAGQKFGNKWGIKEHIGHLSDLEDLHEGRIDDFVAGKETLRPADMTNARTEKANHNLARISQLLKVFTSKRAVFISRLEKLDDKTLSFKSLHPRLNVMMRPVDIAYFTAEHDDHHLVSIREILLTIKDNQ